MLLVFAAVGGAPASAQVLHPLVPAVSQATSAQAYVRVNQVGYAAGAPKRAYLMANVPEAGAMFSVVGDTGPAYTAPIGKRMRTYRPG